MGGNKGSLGSYNIEMEIELKTRRVSDFHTGDCNLPRQYLLIELYEESTIGVSDASSIFKLRTSVELEPYYLASLLLQVYDSSST